MEVLKIKIPLCSLVLFLLVSPMLQMNVKRLEAKYIYKYCESHKVFYISTTSDHIVSKFLTNEVKDTWNDNRNATNGEFELKRSFNLRLIVYQISSH